MTKKPRKKQPVSHETVDGPTPERLKHAGDATIERRIESGRVVLRMADGDILSYLSGRGVINAEQFQCGERIYKDWYDAGLAASGVIDYTRVVVDGGNSEPAMIRKMEAAQNWAGAIRAIGPVHSHPIIAMVLLEEPATVYAMRNTGYKDPKYARVIAYDRLKQALEALVVYYLGKSRKPRPRSFMVDKAGIVPSQTDVA